MRIGEMAQSQLFDLDAPKVILAEGGPMTGEQMRDHAEEFYRRNPSLLAAHVAAARVFQEHGKTVSARALTEFVRYLNNLGVEGVTELANCYGSIDWKRDEPYAVANSTSAWLTRFLEAKGFDVSKARSKMDES